MELQLIDKNYVFWCETTIRNIRQEMLEKMFASKHQANKDKRIWTIKV